MSVGPFLDNNNLIFGLETGTANLRHAKGQPGTNLTTGVNLRWTGANNNGTAFLSNGYEEYVDIPTLGRRLVKSMDIFNDSTTTCCPSLFEYGYSRPVTGGTTYCYQIIYKVASGYTHPNFMYHYEYNGGSYITEYGVHSTSYRTHLGNGWYHAWNTFTTNASCNTIHTGLWYYQYNVYDKVSVAAISITQGSNIRPASQIIESNTTRSNTQAYFDIKRNSTIDVSTTSFDSNGEPYFDGTDDKIDITTNLGTLDEYSFEYVVYTTTAGKMPIATRTSTAFYKYGAYSWKYNHGGTNGEFYHTYGTTNGWSHWVVSYNGSTIAIYQNGSSLGTTSSSGTADFTGGIRIGSWTSSASYTWNGKIPVMRMYNKGLTQTEVERNFNAYQARFGL